MLTLLHTDARECKFAAGAGTSGEGPGRRLPPKGELVIILSLKPSMLNSRPMPTTPHSGDVPATVSWQDVLTSLEDAVMVVDTSRGVAFVNQAAETLTGLSARTMRTRNSDDLFHANGWLLALIDKSLGPDESTSHAENDFVRRRGRRVPVSALVSPLRDQEGGVAGSVLLLRDRTLRQAMEEDLRRSDRLALLGKLAAGLAHEIKNPLGGIKGAAQLLRAEVAHDPSLLENTDIMIREVDRVNQLLDQLLDLARPVGLHVEPLNVHEVLEHVLGLEVRTAAAAKVRIRRSFDPSLPFIMGDRGRLIQVFLNLVENALQARPTCMTLATRIETDFSLRTDRSNPTKFVTIDIRDDGTGIDEEDLPDIFSPFFTRKRRGTGLGLAICDRTVKEHGGRLGVESRLGEGSVFKVSLPAQQG